MPIFTDADVAAAYPFDNVALPHIGIGTFKVVYRIGDGGVEVLKILYRYGSPPEVGDLVDLQIPDRVYRELQALQKIDCPNVVKVVRGPHVVVLGTHSYLAYTEASCNGGSVRDVLDLGVMSESEVRSLLIGVLSGVDTLWRTGQIVHRDIKPENIMFDDSGTPVLVDLGIALHGELSPLTDSGAPSPKTPLYAAPEQFALRREVQIDHRTDQFAAGVTAFEALTGEHPFYKDGMQMDEYFAAQHAFSAEDPRMAGVSVEMRRVLKKLLEPDQYRRYRSIQMALSELGGCA